MRNVLLSLYTSEVLDSQDPMLLNSLNFNDCNIFLICVYCNRTKAFYFFSSSRLLATLMCTYNTRLLNSGRLEYLESAPRQLLFLFLLFYKTDIIILQIRFLYNILRRNADCPMLLPKINLFAAEIRHHRSLYN